MPTLNPVHALKSLVPQSRYERTYLLAALINAVSYTHLTLPTKA